MSPLDWVSVSILKAKDTFLKPGYIFKTERIFEIGPF